MAHDPSLFELVRHPIAMRTLEVKRVVALTPRMTRVTLGGADLAGFRSLAPEDHVKIFFPRPGERDPILPVIGPSGLPAPSDGPKPIARDYTPRRYDPDRGELDVDFFLHGHGVASTWAAQATPGQVVGVAGPRGSYVLTREVAWHLFVGDETAQPEIARRIEELPASVAVRVVLLVDGPEEEQPWPASGPIGARWVHRRAGEVLLDAVRALALPEGEGFAWLAGEASQVRAVYRHLLVDRGLPASHVHASGHWKRGVAAHDHHEPIAVDER
ncbi:siderophore-interacting protein [Sandaracinus amylolyticus]|uniref:Iron-chelator utilization protein n=1 Tax=Sandaracinus amylolyticus TaxID=927083 RepID=A0A0F6W6H3_9BACT|nr:siderophore-interacting protein [Sandaracinus amylolyticus]AKF08725.1 iron-chelator utilization protein [Sandaracinus amylolyticus]